MNSIPSSTSLAGLQNSVSNPLQNSSNTVPTNSVPSNAVPANTVPGNAVSGSQSSSSNANNSSSSPATGDSSSSSNANNQNSGSVSTNPTTLFSGKVAGKGVKILSNGDGYLNGKKVQVAGVPQNLSGEQLEQFKSKLNANTLKLSDYQISVVQPGTENQVPAISVEDAVKNLSDTTAFAPTQAKLDAEKNLLGDGLKQNNVLGTDHNFGGVLGNVADLHSEAFQFAQLQNITGALAFNAQSFQALQNKKDNTLSSISELSTVLNVLKNGVVALKAPINALIQGFKQNAGINSPHKDAYNAANTALADAMQKGYNLKNDSVSALEAAFAPVKQAFDAQQAADKQAKAVHTNLDAALAAAPGSSQAEQVQIAKNVAVQNLNDLKDSTGLAPTDTFADAATYFEKAVNKADEYYTFDNNAINEAYDPNTNAYLFQKTNENQVNLNNLVQKHLDTVQSNNSTAQNYADLAQGLVDINNNLEFSKGQISKLNGSAVTNSGHRFDILAAFEGQANLWLQNLDNKVSSVDNLTKVYQFLSNNTAKA